MKKLALTLAVAASTMAMATVPVVASATTRHHHVRHHPTQSCERWRHRKANQGTATGAVAGGVLGNLVAGHGNRTGGTIIGAGVGAVIGHHIAQRNHRCG